MATVKVLKVVDGIPAGAKVGDDIEVDEKRVDELRTRGAITNVRRVLVAEAGRLGEA